MKARWVITGLIVIAVFAVAVTMVLKKHSTLPKAKEPVAEAAAPVEISLPATLTAVTTIPVAVPIQGKIESFHVEVGGEVYEGQLLAQIRSQALEAVKEVAEIDLERSESRVQALESEVSNTRLEASRAAADASRARNEFDRASRTYQREKMLLAEGATPRNKFEKAEKEYLALEAESKKLDAVASGADERISSTQRELDAARKLFEGKSEDVDHAKDRITAGDVYSPTNGVIVARRGQPGDDVHPSMTDLFQIATDLSLMHAVAEANPSQVSQIKQGQPAMISVAELGGELLEGTVVKIENGKITIEFGNPNPAIKPGLTAQVRIRLT